MIAVLQRVEKAAVYAEGSECGRCGNGLLILLGVTVQDDEEDMRVLCDKIVRLRIFGDDAGKMNLSLADVQGEALVVSNFTLCASYTHGNRPSYLEAARPAQAEPLYLSFAERMRRAGIPTGEGRFGADMRIEMTACGPVTVVMDSERLMGKGKNHDSADRG